MLPLLASCHFLEVEKTGKTSIKNFYSDIYALEAAVSGTYGLTYKFYDSYMVLYPEVTGDLVRFQSGTSEWRQQFDFISDESEETTAVGYIWKNGYEIIESILTSLLVESLLRNVVCLWIKLVVDLLAQVFVVHLMAVFTLHVGAEFL